MKTAFVTGGTGFLGSNLIQVLLSQGWRVVALRRAGSTGAALPSHEGVSAVPGDVTDPASLQAAMPEGVDAVFHVAASLSLWSGAEREQNRINIDGTRHVVEAALARKARRLVHTSTAGAYGLHDGVLTEDTVSNALQQPINYLRSKYLGEQEVRKGVERGLDAVIVNPSNIVGPYDRRGWARLFLLIQAGKLPGVPGGRGTFAHVTEVARAHVAASESGRSGHNYLLGGCDATYLELAQEMARLLGRPGPRRPVPGFVLGAFSRLAALGALFTKREPDITPEGVTILCARGTCSSEKAQRELGFQVRPLREMVADSYRWLVAEGLLAAAPTPAAPSPAQ